MTNKNFHDLFGQNPRNSKKDKITQFHMDIAASIQKVVEDVMLTLASSLRKEFNIPNLCLAGGVALNCVANGKILKEKIFDNIWIQPAAGDAGGSLGAALAYWYHELKKPRENFTDQMKGAYLGPKYSDKHIEDQLNKLKGKYNKKTSNEISSIIAIIFSTSTEEIFSPPEIIISFDRSFIWIYPLGCITAKSPE